MLVSFFTDSLSENVCNIIDIATSGSIPIETRLPMCRYMFGFVMDASGKAGLLSDFEPSDTARDDNHFDLGRV